MVDSRALRRLRRIRDMEEEQSRLALESAVGDLGRLQQAIAATEERDRLGRRLVDASAQSGALADRLTGLEETRSAERTGRLLAPHIAEAERDVAAQREEYTARRVERRQVQTLVEEAKARAALDADRRTQQGLDDWFLNRLRQKQAGAGTKSTEISAHEALPRGGAQRVGGEGNP